MRKIGEHIAKAAVYVCAFAFWAAAMFLTDNLVRLVFRGHIEERAPYCMPRSRAT